MLGFIHKLRHHVEEEEGAYRNGDGIRVSKRYYVISKTTKLPRVSTKTNLHKRYACPCVQTLIFEEK